MEDYVEDYKYNTCFWKKSGVLYNHLTTKFNEYISIGEIFQLISKKINDLSTFLDTVVKKNYKPSDDINCTRSKGISALFDSIKLLSSEFNELSKKIEKISKKILEKEDSFNSKRKAVQMCEECENNYQKNLEKLSQEKKVYFELINKTVEYYLNQKAHKKLQNNKTKKEIENKKNLINNKKIGYKKQIEVVEKSRVDYMELQGNIFASEEELERECTDELRKYFKQFFEILSGFLKTFNIPQEKIENIEKINGDIDIKSFAEKNKSLMIGPQRHLYREYSLDMNYYSDHFDIVKSKIKGKNDKEIREINNRYNTEINDFLKDIIIEEQDEIHIKIEQIAKKIKENNLSEIEFNYLENKFQQKYTEFIKWKQEKVRDQDYLKVGKIWDERFCYMYTFLRYFNKKRVETKELDQTNFNYLCKAIKLILKLNENEDIDYDLCDLIVILSSTFYMEDTTHKNGKKYVNEEIKKCSIMQKQGFWVGLTKFELNEEIQRTNRIEDTLKEEEISESKLNNSIVAKLMSVSFNIIQFVLDSKLFNRIIYDIFKYCKISEENRIFIVGMIETQLQDDNCNNLSLDKELLLSTPPDVQQEGNFGCIKSSNNEKENL